MSKGAAGHWPASALVGLGGALGALARVGVEGLLAGLTGPAAVFPWASLLVNLSGAALLGAVLGLSATRPNCPGWLRPLVGIGFCGAFTTFSAMSAEFQQLQGSGRVGLAVGYFALSFTAGIAAAWAGAAMTAARSGAGRVGQ